MLKATLRSAVLLGLLASFSMPVFAEVQNIKVGGDVTVRGFLRSCMDLNCEDDQTTQDSADNFMTSTTGVNVGADLTENVSAFVRLTSEFDWGNVAAVSDATHDVSLSQAYVTLKELFYSPLTLRLGTQPITWGRGFVLGSNLLPSVATIGNDRHAAIGANEFTDFTAFDAIRATLDLSSFSGIPLTADYVYIKIDENTPGISDDVNIQGINLGTRFDAANSEVETYYLNKRDKSHPATADNNGSVNTLGIRGSAAPTDGLYVFGELGYQFGKNATDSDGLAAIGEHHQAWAFDAGLEYTFKDIAWTPKTGLEWIFWSGKELDGAISGWDPMARGYYTTAIREFIAATNAGFYPTAQAGDTGAASNQHQFAWYGSFKPLEDLVVSPRLTFFFLDKPTVQAAGGQNERNRFAGTEFDTQVVYNYTDDVQLGLLYGLFAPGDVYQSPNDNAAQELVSTVSVKF